MRERWLNFENKQPEKAIVGSACNPKIVSIEITVWLLFAGITMSLSGCIVTYRDFPFVNPLPRPYETTAPPRCRQTVQFPGGMEAGWPYHWTYEDDWSRLRVDRALQGALQHYAGCSSSHRILGIVGVGIGSFSSFPSIVGKGAGSCPTVSTTGMRSERRTNTKLRRSN
jgi:hypothetical protein